MTSDDLLRVTDGNCHLGDRWRSKATPFRVNENVPMRKKDCLNFAHWLNNWHGQVPKLTWSQVTNLKQSKIYNLYELLTSSSSKSLKTLGSELWLWQDAKLAKLRFEVTSLNVTWMPDLMLSGVFFLHRMRKEWMNSYDKFFGAARRRFSAICEKPIGGAYNVPPAVRGLKACSS